ncbi:hypothetical protein BDW75DRAFT_227606 [Aspergillus navahoensis]
MFVCSCSQVVNSGYDLQPNDRREQKRLNLQSHICNLALGEALYRAPIESEIQKILDLGTGTGALPPNSRLEIDDFEWEWDYPHPFDYIHMRDIEGSICDFTVGIFSDGDSAEKTISMQRWRGLLVEASKKCGRQFSMAQNYKQKFKVPFSPWPKDPKLKDLGSLQQANMLEALDAYSLALMNRFLGWTVEDVRVLPAKVRKELMDWKLHIYSRLYVVFGRRECA